MKQLLTMGAVLLAATSLSGCVVEPTRSGYYGGQVEYASPSPPVYYQPPPPVYYRPPPPALIINLTPGGGHHEDHHDHHDDHDDHHNDHNQHDQHDQHEQHDQHDPYNHNGY